MKMNVGQFAKHTGVSVRTLHYYDEIGLLKPDFVDEKTGYRFYGAAAARRMQEILFYRELDFSLKDIQTILSSPDYNRQEALREQRQLLLLKKQRLEKLLALLERAEKGENSMEFEAFSHQKIEEYQKEARQRWGATQAYQEHQQKTADYSDEKWADVAANLNKILADFAKLKASGEAPDSEAAAVQVRKLQTFITRTQYCCTDEILADLGQMYVADERFRRNIDKNGAGTAHFVSAAIQAFCK